MTKAQKITETAAVYLTNGGIKDEPCNRVQWRCIKNGKFSGKSFSKRFDSEAAAEAFYATKGEA